MQIIQTIAELKNIRAKIKSQVGFVPTMGNLHAGHLSLLQAALTDNEVTFLSIFINPTQFNNEDDFHHYPKTLAKDLAQAEALQVDYVFIPTQEEMYPDQYSYKIVETSLSHRLEGKYRPRHFEGMLTIVMKLLLLVLPQRAYFGEKDYQQYQLICRLAQAFFLPTKIVACQTVREPSGLAMSSRNNFLSDEQKEQAKLFPKYFHSGLPCQQIKELLIKAGFVVDYVEEYENRRFAAVRIGSIRLIDNIPT